MFCKHCGTQIPDDSQLCPNCGAATSAAPVQSTPVQSAPASRSVALPASVNELVKNPPRWLIAVVAAVAVLAIWFCFIRKNPTKDLKEYVFLDYGVAPFETVVESIMPDAKWSSDSQGSGRYTVTVSGYYLEGQTPITIVFSAYYMGDTPVFQPISGQSKYMQSTDRYDLEDLIEEMYDMYADAYAFGW